MNNGQYLAFESEDKGKISRGIAAPFVSYRHERHFLKVHPFLQLHYAANYEFGYRVHDHHSGNDFGHHEVKRGEDTKGFYHVLLPDGRTQKVKYHAGPDGFHADISYDHLQR
ncbi:Pro-resilin [Eumeta japonica]|uniref:Pro-resilin n=1 Tax=Eumeta variegata TaxID=151549 RepID=A0A4C1WUK4_EUMVA|nr:Pro-resilin [Eumeta japonica]